ncbi:unnamed protein product [Lupinus luteus]|uniref:Ferritin n=1 Tax=Lupinus luteus TaxID=3873 RepID=A0AAV1X7P0_LUPLU
MTRELQLNSEPNPDHFHSNLLSFVQKYGTEVTKAFFPSFSSLPLLNSERSVIQSPRNSISFEMNQNLKTVSGKNGVDDSALKGSLCELSKEVTKELDLVPAMKELGLVSEVPQAHHKYIDECEATLNDQINVVYNISYIYHALYAYFDRDTVALKGFANFFKESSEEKRRLAEKMMEYQNKLGREVKLQSILMPLSEFDHADKGDALHAMELTLSLEKLTSDTLLHLHRVASKNGDVQLAYFAIAESGGKQVNVIKEIAEYIAQLKRLGKGPGVWRFDQMLLGKLRNGVVVCY